MATAISAVMPNQSRVLQREPGGVGHAAQADHADHDGGEDQRRHGQLEQLDEEAADGVRVLVSQLRSLAAGEEAERDAEHEAEQDLHGEGNFAQAEGHEDVSNCPGLIGAGVGTRLARTDAAGLQSEIDIQADGEVPDIGHRRPTIRRCRPSRRSGTA